MNCWNSPLVEVVMGTGKRTGAFEGPTPLVAGVSLGFTGCFDSLGPTVLGGTFLQEREPRAISAKWNLLLFN